MLSTTWNWFSRTSAKWYQSTHLSLDKMAAISQTTFSTACSSMKMLEFWFKFHWGLFLAIQLTIFQHRIGQSREIYSNSVPLSPPHWPYPKRIRPLSWPRVAIASSTQNTKLFIWRTWPGAGAVPKWQFFFFHTHVTLQMGTHLNKKSAPLRQH